VIRDLIPPLIAVGIAGFTASILTSSAPSADPGAPKVISLTLAADELLVSILPRDRLLGVTPFGTWPGASAVGDQFASLPTFAASDVERIVSARPDLVVVAAFSDGGPAELLRGAGVRTVRLGNYDSLEGIRRSTLALADAVGERAAGERVGAWMLQVLAEVRRAVASRSWTPRVLYWSPGGVSAGQGSLMDELITTAGARNVAAELGLRGFGRLGEEVAIAADPEVILVLAGDPSNPASDPRRSLLVNSAWERTSAVRQGRVVVLPARHAGSISHFVVLGAVDLARALHPELAGSIQADPPPKR
jgi:iron complex transport system substrate-binding protein